MKNKIWYAGYILSVVIVLIIFFKKCRIYAACGVSQTPSSYYQREVLQ